MLQGNTRSASAPTFSAHMMHVVGFQSTSNCGAAYWSSDGCDSQKALSCIAAVCDAFFWLE